MYVSHGGKCIETKNSEGNLTQEYPAISKVYTSSVSLGNILVRSTDTDVLGFAGRSERITIILDFGFGNHRRYILVSNLAANLDEK